MFTIDQDNAIRMSRGDSLYFSVFLNTGTTLQPQRYTLGTGDILYFAVMEPNQKFENALIKKSYTSEDKKNENGDTIIEFTPEDTENVISGMYYYTVKLQRFKDETSYSVDTVIPKRRFIIED